MDAVTYLGLELKDWSVITATVLGPILAVQAQKVVEYLREQRKRKTLLFEQLMATRASTLSPEHVRALNMIDLVFYGGSTFWFHQRSKKEQLILDGWKEYLDHLGQKPEGANIQAWNDRREEFFINLLFAMAQDIGYKFDRVQLKRGIYSPIAHGELEAEQTELRKAALSLIKGSHSMKMNVVGFPVDPDVFAANKEMIKNLGEALKEGVLRVEIETKK